MTLVFCLTGLQSLAQVDNPYFLNGNATQDNCNCYTLTKDENFRSGSVWNIYKISLNDPFDFRFSVYLGNNDGGADGMAFVLQPISTNIGSVGGGLGFSGVSPSLGITIDTWQNNENTDPVYDHITIQRNGNLNHNSADNLAGPVTAIEGNNNIEDGSWHELRVEWDPLSKTVRASVDGKERVKTVIDLVGTVFNGDPLVFWGFTASTGGARNLQRFCTALQPRFKKPGALETCFGKPVSFIDSSSSFGSIVKWFWDFGDGTKDSVQNPPPHLYAAPGNYEVKLNIVGNNGCLSDTLREIITIGSDPFANIGWQPSGLCANTPLQLQDLSSVQYGTVNKWAWTVQGRNYTEANPIIDPPFGSGAIPVSLQVFTVEGCISPVKTINIPVLPVPEIVMDVQDACIGNPVLLRGENSSPALNITTWYWDLGDGRTDSTGASIKTNYDSAGSYTISLTARASNGCFAASQTKKVGVYQTAAFAGRDTTVAIGQPFQLRGSGGSFYRWTPASGLSDPNIADPIATLQSNTEYILSAFTPLGCGTSDTIRISVFKGPEIYVPTAFTPNGDRLNDIMKVLPIGVTLEQFRIYDRWGALIFSTTDPSRGWDGTLKGKPAPHGNYIWVVQGKDFTGKAIFKKGLVTLIR